ncbi:MAG: hypothetical protein EWM72_02563 [Nitrospira sp.]|nr:MAG: hypothetical protein EWM72_02563 [Nitrospira sp.]
MVIQDDVRECVGFLYAGGQNKSKQIMGTVFFVSVVDDSNPVSHVAWTYAITARHVIEDIKKWGDDGKVHIRLNRTSGGSKYVDVKIDGWKPHPHDRLLDVMVLQCDILRGFDVKTIPVKMFLDDRTISLYGIGPGDETFIVGLFEPHPGTDRNIPIVRIGNIAAMPNEPIKTKRGDGKAYLIEARSISGLSGSPVFLNIGPSRVVNGNVMYAHDDDGYQVPSKCFFLGSVRGHYDSELRDRTKSRMLNEDEFINVGIAMVVPSQQIFEALNQKEFVVERGKQKEEEKPKYFPTEDSSLLARSVVEAAIGEPLIRPKSKPKKRAKKGG